MSTPAGWVVEFSSLSSAFLALAAMGKMHFGIDVISCFATVHFLCTVHFLAFCVVFET